MPNYKFYCVARGIQPGIYLSWSQFELQVHKYPNAVHQGCHTIDQAVAFLIVGQAFTNCENIPIFDNSGLQKLPKDFGHQCIGPPCPGDSSDLDLSNENITCSFDNFIHNVDVNDIIDVPDTSINTQTVADNQMNQLIEETNLKELFISDQLVSPVVESAHETDQKLNLEETNSLLDVDNPVKSSSEVACTQYCEDPPNSQMILCSKMSKNGLTLTAPVCQCICYIL